MGGCAGGAAARRRRAQTPQSCRYRRQCCCPAAAAGTSAAITTAANAACALLLACGARELTALPCPTLHPRSPRSGPPCRPRPAAGAAPPPAAGSPRQTPAAPAVRECGTSGQRHQVARGRTQALGCRCRESPSKRRRAARSAGSPPPPARPLKCACLAQRLCCCCRRRLLLLLLAGGRGRVGGLRLLALLRAAAAALLLGRRSPLPLPRRRCRRHGPGRLQGGPGRCASLLHRGAGRGGPRAGLQGASNVRGHRCAGDKRAWGPCDRKFRVWGTARAREQGNGRARGLRRAAPSATGRAALHAQRARIGGRLQPPQSLSARW